MTFAIDASGLEAGFALGAASMFSVGPNNLMLIREGLAKGRAALAASLVVGSYAALISASLLLAGAVAKVDHSFRVGATGLGFLVISWFALQSLRLALAGGRPDDTIGALEPAGTCCIRILAVVWLNPLTYLELLVLPAAVSQTFGGNAARVEFASALIFVSTLYCYGYALCGGLIASTIRARSSLRAFDLISGLLLAAVATSLGGHLIGEALP